MSYLQDLLSDRLRNCVIDDEIVERFKDVVIAAIELEARWEDSFERDEGFESGVFNHLDPMNHENGKISLVDALLELYEVL